MVRNDRLKKTGESTKLIAEFVEERRRAKSLTQKQIASALGEKTSQSYVSVRLRGKAAWTMDDLDAIAPLIDFDNAIELIGNLARKRAAEENGPGLLARQFVAIMDGTTSFRLLMGHPLPFRSPDFPMTHQSIRALPPIREARVLFLVHVRLNPRLYPMKSVSGSFWRNYVGATCPWRRTRIRISSRKWKAVTAASDDCLPWA